MTIGIFGGSFNPVHSGHILLGRHLLTAAVSPVIDELWYMLTPQNPLKQRDGLMPDELRMELLQLALCDEPGLVACDFELSLPRPSYTVDTLAALRTRYPQHEFVLVIGADNLLSLDHWRQPDEILRHHRLLVYRRPGYELGELPRNTTIVETPLYDISSTEIRQRMQHPSYQGEGLPARVWQRLKNVNRQLK